MKIEFHGAARSVTGSCHLVEAAGVRILVDCGFYQGGRELDEENAEDFGFDPSSIDYVLLTHAHLDHCGRLPLLARRGFVGEIVATSATRELARLVMLDAANLQEEEARYRTRRLARSARSGGDIKPLYSTLDALKTLDYFGPPARYDTPFELAPGVRATFVDAGHILGSACIHLAFEEDEGARRVLFSGDLGNSGRPILRDPAQPPEADVVVMETTYGNRPHKALQSSVAELFEVIAETLDEGGNVIIPSFALERAQEILYYLSEGIGAKHLPRRLPVFLDSPMAISATEIFQRHAECYDRETRELFREGRDPFAFPGLHFVRESAESMTINQITGGAVIIAGSGMCTGGRIRHHLKHNLWRRECSIVFVGYAAQGTPARAIIDGAERVRLFGEEIPVRAKIHTIGGFSAHADRDELLAWHRQAGRPEKTFLVHGEYEVAREFARHLDGAGVEIPELHEAFDL